MGIMLTLRKISAIFNVLRSGGNFNLIAQRVTALYTAVGMTPYTLTEDQKIYAAALIDATPYIKTGSFTEADVRRCILYGHIGTIGIDLYSVNHRDMFTYEDNSLLIGTIMQLETTIFDSEYPGKLHYKDIVASVLSNKGKITNTVSKTLKQGSYTRHFREVMIEAATYLAMPQFREEVMSLTEETLSK